HAIRDFGTGYMPNSNITSIFISQYEYIEIYMMFINQSGVEAVVVPALRNGSFSLLQRVDSCHFMIVYSYYLPKSIYRHIEILHVHVSSPVRSIRSDLCGDIGVPNSLGTSARCISSIPKNNQFKSSEGKLSVYVGR